MNQKALQRHLRLLSWVLALAGVLYLFVRYDSYDLPIEGCSPLLRFAPGDRLLVDRHPSGFHAKDAVIFLGSDGLLYLGIVARVRPEGAEPGQVAELWLETDSPDCPGKDSDEFGWVPIADVAARVILTWPW